MAFDWCNTSWMSDRKRPISWKISWNCQSSSGDKLSKCCRRSKAAINGSKVESYGLEPKSWGHGSSKSKWKSYRFSRKPSELEYQKKHVQLFPSNLCNVSMTCTSCAQVNWWEHTQLQCLRLPSCALPSASASCHEDETRTNRTRGRPATQFTNRLYVCVHTWMLQCKHHIV